MMYAGNEKVFLRSLRDGRDDLQDTKKKDYRKHTRRVAISQNNRLLYFWTI